MNMNMNATLRRWIEEMHPLLDVDLVALNPLLMGVLMWERREGRIEACRDQGTRRGCGAPLIFLRYVKVDGRLSNMSPVNYGMQHGDGGPLIINL